MKYAGRTRPLTVLGGPGRFRVPVERVEAVRAECDCPATRSLARWTPGKKVFRVLAWLSGEALRAKAARGVARWEELQRRYRVRSFGPHDYGFLASDEPRDLTPEDWRRMGDGPALLFVHGTFSTEASWLRQLPGSRAQSPRPASQSAPAPNGVQS